MILVFGVIAAVFCTAAGRNYDDTVVSLSEGWTSDDGSSYALNDLPLGDVTVSRSLEGIDLKGKSLCFKSADTHITVSFGGETAYTYAPEYPKLFGKSYGVYVHMVKIPEGAREVTLSLHPIYKERTANISRCAVQDGAMFMSDIYKAGLPSFAMCVLIGLFGVLMLIIGLIKCALRAGSSGGIPVWGYALL